MAIVEYMLYSLGISSVICSKGIVPVCGYFLLIFLSALRLLLWYFALWLWLLDLSSLGSWRGFGWWFSISYILFRSIPLLFGILVAILMILCSIFLVFYYDILLWVLCAYCLSLTVFELITFKFKFYILQVFLVCVCSMPTTILNELSTIMQFFLVSFRVDSYLIVEFCYFFLVSQFCPSYFHLSYL